MRIVTPFILIFLAIHAGAQTFRSATISELTEGWAGNSVNTVIFRKNAICSAGKYQFTAFYNQEGFVVLGKRKRSSDHWELKKTAFRGNIQDAHNSISIMADGEGFLHMAWDQHNNKLNYVISREPYSLEMGEPGPMTGEIETKVSYPEFYQLKGGNLLFLYRDGSSGNGNLVLNVYSTRNGKWTQLHRNLIDGEGKRNAYWQACVDTRGVIHISWVWRESPDVETNHDLCYASSEDGGLTWKNANGQTCPLPIRASNAGYVQKIPPGSGLMNQTAMTTDPAGHPMITTYWRNNTDSITQYHLLYLSEQGWTDLNTGFRSTAFPLRGMGTRRIPISRPQVICGQKKGRTWAMIIFRDEERGNRISGAICTDLSKASWQLKDLFQENMGSWEPLYDPDSWKKRKRLDLFVQHTEQGDGELITDTRPQLVRVLSLKIR